MASSSRPIFDDIEEIERLGSNQETQNSDTSTTSTNRKKTSNVWNYFELIETQDSRKAKCKVCHKEYVHPRGSGNGTLVRHIKANHQQKEATQTQLSHLTGQLASFTFNKKKCREAWGKYIVQAERPFGMCDDERWVDTMRIADNPQHERIPRTSMRSSIFQMYEDYKNILIATLTSMPCQIALTSDVWTSPNGQYFICVTAHYIDEDWILQKRIINFAPTNFHTGHDIAFFINSTLQEYQIANKIISITFDNASSNNLAIDILKSQLEPMLGGRLFHSRCACHIINLCVRDGLQGFEESISKIKNAILLIRSSVARKNEFKVMCQQFNVRPRKFKLDVPTRWNSTLEMLLSIQGLEEPLMHFYNSKHAHDPIDPSDLVACQMICMFLQTFCDATKQFSGIYYPTIHSILSHLVHISTFFNEIKATTSSFINATNMMEIKFLKYWFNLPLTFCLGSILDPRQKETMLHILLDTYEENFRSDEVNVQNLKEQVNEIIYEMYNIYSSKFGVRMPQPQTHSQSSSSHGSKSSYKLFMEKMVANKRQKQSSSQSGNVINELTIYLNKEMEQDDEEPLDLLKWWKDHQRTYPILAAMARDILCIPVSSVASESAFSAGGRVLTPKRASLSDEALRVCVCLKDWLDAESRKQDQDDDNDAIVAALTDSDDGNGGVGPS